MDIRKEDISKMRLRVGICNNEIINAQTELVISHIKKVHKDVSFTKFDIGGGRHFNTSGIAGAKILSPSLSIPAFLQNTDLRYCLLFSQSD